MTETPMKLNKMTKISPNLKITKILLKPYKMIEMPPKAKNLPKYS